MRGEVDEPGQEPGDMILLPEPDPPAEESPSDAFYVHPDNWPAYQLFQQLRTQWRTAIGLGGIAYLGLDYSAVASFLSLMVPKKHRRQRFQEIRLIEAGALSVINGKDLSDNAADSW